MKNSLSMQVSEDGELRAVLAVVDEDNDALTIWVEPRALDPFEVFPHAVFKCVSLKWPEASDAPTVGHA